MINLFFCLMMYFQNWISNRQNYLLQAIDDTQTIITCTGLDDFVKNRFTLNKVYEVENGCVHLHSNMMEDKNESE